MPVIPRVYSLPLWKSGVAFGPTPCAAAGVCRRIRRRVARVPQLFARLGFERGHHLGSVPPGEDVDGVGNDEGRRVALSDVDLPLARQRFGPRCRLSERAGRAVAVQPAPLWIVLRRALCAAAVPAHPISTAPPTNSQHRADLCPVIDLAEASTNASLRAEPYHARRRCPPPRSSRRGSRRCPRRGARSRRPA